MALVCRKFYKNQHRYIRKLCSTFLQRTGVTLFSINLNQIEANSDKNINNIYSKENF